MSERQPNYGTGQNLPEPLYTNDASRDYIFTEQNRSEQESNQEQQASLPEPLFTRDGTEVYPLAALANHFDMTASWLRALVKLELNGEPRVRSLKPDRDIFVSFVDVQKYLNSPRRKPGPPRGHRRGHIEAGPSNVQEHHASEGSPVDFYTADGTLIWPLAFVAEHYGISIPRLHELIREQRIQGVKNGRDLFVSPAAVENYINNPRKPGPKPKNPPASPQN